MGFLEQLGCVDVGVVEEREYQVNVFNECCGCNSLVVLPTGLGKTVIAGFLVADRVSMGSVLLMSPTKPLCEQHHDFLDEMLDGVEVCLVTGGLYGPEDRAEVWRGDGVFIATPQTVRNDVEAGRLDLTGYSLVVFDEAHRAVGDYAYSVVADQYFRQAKDPQTLGLTASPGSDIDRLREVSDNLRIENVSIRGDWSSDVQPYLGEMDISWVELEKPLEMLVVEDALEEILKDFLDRLGQYTKQVRNMKPDNISKKALIEVQNRFRSQLNQGGSGYVYQALSYTASCIKTAHMKDLLTSQGPESLQRYIEQIEEDDSKAAERIRRRQEYPRIKKALKNVDNHKLDKTKEIIQKQVKNNERAIIFAEYRHTVETLVKQLNKTNKIKARKFIGQAKSHGKNGMTQKQQKKTLNKFRQGKFNTLVSTRIGEEGIDIPQTSLVLFYEPVPSAIRLIQRKGRTARDGSFGKVIILIMKNSQDEAYYWKSQKDQKKMYKIAYKLKNELNPKTKPDQGQEKQSQLDRFT
ncbi:ERCC4-like helicase MPH1 [Methanonatronarchaeum thermophilum]|uniref:ERCC4-like helicase MPH1 n=1 Tax=Methanonatronarchaeum thermophilum TaxID=1927129 RepID=A0A1Y3GA25_9EURY|nr:helicase-related protein [Methanonatronarchaeum thermophilum]OUJ18117.1 ERCC4-like helicase MPH1 [Methanonatronarchaeum thermophilum]